jgi:hypothetical protein
MYTRLLRKSAHTKRFTVSHHPSSGWAVREEEDSQVIVRVHYRDWHRVERAMEAFATKAELLRQRGWSDHSIGDRLSRV